MSLIRRGFHIASKQLAYLSIILLTLFVISFGVIVWLSGEVEQRQEEISTWAGDRVGYPVEIGEAGIDWLGLLPKLQLESVKILDKERRNEIISLDKLYIGLDLFASIIQGEPVLNDVTLTGLEISLERDLAGNLQVIGFDERGSSSNNHEWLSWLRILNRFNLQSIIVDYSDQLSPELSGQYQLTNAILSHKSDQWTTAANVRLPSMLGQQLQFQGKAEANLENLNTSTWQWQVKTKGLKLEQLSKQFTWKDIAVEQGSADIQLSGKGHGNTFDSVVADLVLSKSKIVSQQEKGSHEPVTIENLVGIFDWQSQEGAWQLSGRDIQLHMNGDAWPKTGFMVKKNNDDSWLVASNYVRLSDITSVASLSKYSPELLRKQKPAGDLETINLRYSAERGLTGLAFNLRDGVFQSWDEYPGVTGLTVAVKWSDGLANIKLDSHKLTLYADKWLDDAIFFDSVTGSLDLQKAEKTWLAKSDELRVWNDDLTLQLDGQIEKQADGEIINAIKITLEEVSVASWQNYVPQKILSESFKNWSNKAFQAGKIVDGDIEWVGKVSSFPYKDDTDSGFFNMQLNAEDIQLHYVDGWPDLLGITGIITGHGHDLIIKSKQGKIAGFDFVDVTTVITKLNEDNPILSVEGDLTGTTKHAALFLQNSPLNERFGSALKSVDLTGGSNIHLNLMVPLADADKTEALGFVSFIDSQLNHTAVEKLGLRNVNGQLHFDNNGVYAENITANLFNEPVKINVKPNDGHTKISLTGHVSTKEVESLWPDKLPSFINGETDYNVDMTVIEKTIGDFYLNTEFTSDLQGIEIAIPQPFTKLKEDKHPFSISMMNVENELVYSSNYGNEVNVIAVPNKEGLRAAIKFGEGKAVLPNNGIKIRGKLAELSIDDWLDWSKSLGETKNNSLLSDIDDVSMTINSLTGFEQKLTTLNYSVNKDGQGWRVKLNSDQTKGSVYWPSDFNGQVPLEINLDQLVLSLPKPRDKGNEQVETKMSLWPAMKINITSLMVDNIKLGTLELQASRNAQTWSIDSASLVSTVFNAGIIEKSSSWQQSSMGQKSNIALQIESDDLAGLLANFGYQQVIDSESNKLTVVLAWPDHPFELSTKNVTGQINVAMGKGKLNDVEPGAAGRIFGLMSIAALPRRLSLDFSELFSSGFTFDSIKGDFNLANGHAVTDNLTLRGAAAKIEMSGPIDLVNQRYDQQVKVTPNVSSTLPLAGAVAGGPIGLGVGAALLVVDKLSGKLFGKNIVNLISYTYNLTGPWNDPQLRVVTAAEAVTPVIQ